jgi:hypothetical protein
MPAWWFCPRKESLILKCLSLFQIHEPHHFHCIALREALDDLLECPAARQIRFPPVSEKRMCGFGFSISCFECSW